MKTIGILGGIGPESTGHFYLNLIANFQKQFAPKDNTEYPRIIINSVPAPELIYDVKQSTLDFYIKSLRQLENDNCDFIAIVCNTAHCFLDEFKKEIKTPIINLPEELQKYLLDKIVETVTRLLSPTGYKNNLYKFSGIDYNDPAKEEIAILEESIANFNIGNNKPEQIRKVNEIYNKYATTSDIVILGCSELACMIKEKNNEDKKIVDPMSLLVDLTLNNL